jgi:hypothetical protein
MSALQPIATEERTWRHVRNVPRGDLVTGAPNTRFRLGVSYFEDSPYYVGRIVTNEGTMDPYKMNDALEPGSA